MNAPSLPRMMAITGWLVVFMAACHEAKRSSSPASEEDSEHARDNELSTPRAISSLPQPAPSSGSTERAACPVDMVLVGGLFCPQVEQRCLFKDPNSGRSTARCLRFDQPSRCQSKQKELMRFCVDRYEWPNRQGEKPRVLVSWTEARTLCESRGKRLCTEDEWLFACEGEEMLPYTHGFERDPTACVIDRMYVPPEGGYRRWDECNADAKCAEAFQRVDQREPSGHFPRCRSPFGAYDMNGNANEWVQIPGEVYPRRSGIKGGWWGPVRNRCRPTVRFHKEDDWGYEVGFRCCQASEP